MNFFECLTNLPNSISFAIFFKVDLQTKKESFLARSPSLDFIFSTKSFEAIIKPKTLSPKNSKRS